MPIIVLRRLGELVALRDCGAEEHLPRACDRFSRSRRVSFIAQATFIPA